jgi:hypothetical protein
MTLQRRAKRSDAGSGILLKDFDAAPFWSGASILKITRLRAFLGSIVIVAGFTVAPFAGAYPSGACARTDIGSLVPEANAYTLCTSVGWVHVNEPVRLDPSGDCAHLGTVGPHGGQPYTICTNMGWVDVNRPVCADFPAWFDCAGNPKT